MIYKIEKERESVEEKKQIVESYLADHGFNCIIADKSNGVPQYNAAELLVIKRLDNEIGVGKYELLTTNLNNRVWYKVKMK